MFAASADRRTEPILGEKGSIFVDGEVCIPPGINDLDSFREWARSDNYPKRGDYCWLNGVFWVDLSMEDAYTHGLVRTAVVKTLETINEERDLGDVYDDTMRVSEANSDLSCEPDVLFASHETFESGALREIAGKKKGSVVEFEGAPDLVVEIVSDSSERKDLSILPDQLFAAGVKEYWLIDARGEHPFLDIFRRGPIGFLKVPIRSKKVRSSVFGCSFQLTRTINRRGRPKYRLLYS